MKKTHKTSECLNCGFNFKKMPKDNFCPECGQKNTDKKFTIYELGSELINNTIKLDFKLIKSLGLLFNPGFLTNAINNGKRAQFTSPVRLFTFASILYFVCFNLVAYYNRYNDNQNSIELLYTEVEKVKHPEAKNLSETFVNRLNTMMEPSNKSLVDSGKVWVPVAISKNDTVPLFPPYQILDPKMQKAYPLILGKIDYEPEFILDSLNIAHNPVYLYGLEEVKKIKSLGLEEYFNGWIKYVSISILLLIPIFALFLKALYFRKKILYIDHLVFALHFHAILYIYLLFSLVLRFVSPGIALSCTLLMFIFMFFSLKNVYKETNTKTILKQVFLITIFFFMISTIPSLFISYIIQF